MNAAESLIYRIGIERPDEIDLELIVFSVGATVRYRNLKGCEARILGLGNKAIITVNNASSKSRQRFSIAHELGHWHLHRGRCLACRADDENQFSKSALEREANVYAAHLLMPNFLLLKQLPRVDQFRLSDIVQTATVFKTSLTASAIRICEATNASKVIICTEKGRIKWKRVPQSISHLWKLRDEVDHRSLAFDINFKSVAQQRARKMNASVWFDQKHMERFDLEEECVPTYGSEALSILHLDQKMLNAS